MRPSEEKSVIGCVWRGEGRMEMGKEEEKYSEIYEETQNPFKGEEKYTVYMESTGEERRYEFIVCMCH